MIRNVELSFCETAFPPDLNQAFVLAGVCSEHAHCEEHEEDEDKAAGDGDGDDGGLEP